MLVLYKFLFMDGIMKILAGLSLPEGKGVFFPPLWALSCVLCSCVLCGCLMEHLGMLGTSELGLSLEYITFR